MKKMKRNNLQRIIAAALAAVLLLSLCTAAFAAEKTLSIRTANDLIAFAENCSSDTYSKGLKVVLEADIDLAGTAVSIPIFLGTFDGQGHKIFGLRLTESNSYYGLFSRVTSDAVIKNLTVEGTVAPAGTQKVIGGIAGENSGKIENCRFAGVVTGSRSVGGIAGSNAGTISGCTFSGAVKGLQYTGGIAGENSGTLLRCENMAAVNTTVSEAELSAVDMESTIYSILKQEDSVENAVTTDTGGIVGWSTGVVQSCVNNGMVGYPHVGYNVGGIAGRQNGYLASCANYGEIKGRKDVGGIVGQMVPDITLQFSENELDELQRELNTLQSLIDRTLDDAQEASDSVSDRVSRISGYADSARSSANSMTEQLTDFADSNIETANNLLLLTERYLDKLAPILDDLSAASDSMADSLTEVRKLVDMLDETLVYNDAVLAQLQDFCTETKAACDALLSGLDYLEYAFSLMEDGPALPDTAQIREDIERLLSALEALNETIGIALDEYQTTGSVSAQTQEKLREDMAVVLERFAAMAADGRELVDSMDPDELKRQSEETLRKILSSLQSAAESFYSAVSHFSAAMGYLYDALGTLRAVNTQMEGILAQLDAVISSAQQLAEAMLGTLSKLAQWVRELSNEDVGSFSPFGPEFRSDNEALNASLGGISNELSALNREIDRSNTMLLSDIRAVNTQFMKVMNLFLNILNSTQNVDYSEIFEDVSEESIKSAMRGKVLECGNYGDVTADRNVGGIAGAMAIEYDLDPEDDLLSADNRSLRFTYQTKAILLDSNNYGVVKAKKSCAGGIVGRMDLGTVSGCGGWGRVESESGDYVGGVAGLSLSSVRSSYAKCTLSGTQYVGGITGSGSRISDSISMVEIDNCTQFGGAIAGEITGEYSGNYFVSDKLAGVDRVSLSGKTEQINYDALGKIKGLPKNFLRLSLRFTDGAITLKELFFDYGASFDDDDYPDIPEKDGCYAYWDKTDLNALHFDTVVTAVYEPYVTTLAVEDSRESGKPVFYVEGDYDGTEQPTALAQQKLSADFAPISAGLGAAIEHYLTDNAWYTWLTTPLCREVVEQWSLTVPADGQESHKVHYLPPDDAPDRRWVFVKQDGAWTKLDGEKFGSYLVFSLPDGESEIAVVSVLYIWWVWAILLVLFALLPVCIVLLCGKRRKKRRVQRQQAAEAGEDAPALPPKKKKRWVLPLIIGLLVLTLAAAAALYFLTCFDSQITVYQTLTSLEEQKELSASLTVDTEIGEESLHTQTELARKTVDGVQITRLELESVPLYYADEQVILENGRSYRLGKLFPDYSDLLGLIVPLYQDMKFAENEDTCQVSVKGETAKKVLQTIVPNIAAQLSETQELTVTVERADDTVQRIDISASGVLRDDVGSNFSVFVCMDSVESSSDIEVPQAVIDTAKEGTDSDAPVITEDLLRLLSAWDKENKKDSVTADVTLLADCDPVVLRDSLKLYRQTTEEQSIYCISKGGVNFYWSDGTVVNENGQAVPGENAKSAQTAKLPEIAYLACQEGDFTKHEQDGAYVYSVRLDADTMSEVASIIAPDAEKLDSVFRTGTLTVNICDGEMTGFAIFCTGTVTVSSAKVSATVAAEFAMTNETVTISKRVASSIGIE